MKTTAQPLAEIVSTSALPTLDALVRALVRDAVREVVREELAALQLGVPTAANDTPPPASSFLSPQEAARLLGVTERTIRAQVKSGRLRAHRLGRLLRIDRTDLERCLKEAAATEGTPVDIDGIALRLLKGRRGRTERDPK